ncbi:MAG: hypothetical protein JNL88_04385, partial [Bacteroidia bacterium]|nr:hypothetical protein [Bacteroidia bacterium]
DVRDAALTALDEHYDNDDLLVYFKNASQDSSFTVMETALNAVASRDKEEALKMADGFEANDHKRVMGMLSRLYSRFGNDAQAAYMKKALEGSSGFSTYNQLQQYGRFLKRCSDQKNITSGLLTIYSTGKTAGEWVVRLAAAQSLAEYGNHCTEQLKVARKAADKDSEERWTSHQELASKYLDDLKKNETNETLLKIYNSSRQ